MAEGLGGFAVSTNSELSAVLQQIATPPVNAVTGKPTFTLVAVRLPESFPPTQWKLTSD